MSMMLSASIVGRQADDAPNFSAVKVTHSVCGTFLATAPLAAMRARQCPS